MNKKQRTQSMIEYYRRYAGIGEQFSALFALMSFEMGMDIEGVTPPEMQERGVRKAALDGAMLADRIDELRALMYERAGMSDVASKLRELKFPGTNHLPN